MMSGRVMRGRVAEWSRAISILTPWLSNYFRGECGVLMMTSKQGRGKGTRILRDLLDELLVTHSGFLTLVNLLGMTNECDKTDLIRYNTIQ